MTSAIFVVDLACNWFVAELTTYLCVVVAAVVVADVVVTYSAYVEYVLDEQTFLVDWAEHKKFTTMLREPFVLKQVNGQIIKMIILTDFATS